MASKTIITAGTDPGRWRHKSEIPARHSRLPPTRERQQDPGMAQAEKKSRGIQAPDLNGSRKVRRWLFAATSPIGGTSEGTIS